MAWCPNCKNEYVEGITICADCGARLVESLDEVQEEKISPEPSEEMAEENIWDGAAAEETDIEPADNDTAQEKGWRNVYQNSAQKAEDNKSSAYMLLIIGALGLIGSILILTGVIPLYRNALTTRYFVCGVMGALFLLFIVFGIISMKTFKVLSMKAASEDSLVEEITKWCQENLYAASIDEGLFDTEEIAEEQKYFRRVDKMKQMIQAQYMNLDDAFLDHFIDDYYQNLF